MRLASILYLPNASVSLQRTGGCLANLAAYRHKYPIYAYSEAPWHPSVFSNLGACTFSRIRDPEMVRNGNSTVEVSRFIYFTGLEMMEEAGMDYFMVLENDSRICGDNWDEELFDEFFAGAVKGRDPAVGGTIFSWSPMNQEMNHALEFIRFFDRANKVVFGNKVWLPGCFIYAGGQAGSCEDRPGCCYANGALSIAKTSVIRSIFGIQDVISLCNGRGGNWDSEIGMGMFRLFGWKAYEHIVPMRKVFSVYGDKLTTEKQRINLLTSGQCRGVHQVKSSWPL